MRFKPNDVILVECGYNEVTKKSHQYLYEFGYYGNGGCFVYKHGSRNENDSIWFMLDDIKLATEEDKKNFWWGS